MGSISSGVAGCGGNNERRSSWASASPAAAMAAGGGTAALNISAQQHAQLERLYRQSITTGSSGQQVGSGSGGGAAGAGSDQQQALSGVQQLQLEFQKLCATTNAKKDSSPTPASSGFRYLCA